MSREEFIRTLEDRHIIDRRQITRAQISPYSVCSAEEDYSVCSMVLEGIGGSFDADIISLEVFVSGKSVKTAEIPVASQEKRCLIVTIPKESVPSFEGTTQECNVLLRDKYGRTILSSIYKITFDGPAPLPSVVGRAVFQKHIYIKDGDTSANVVDLHLISDRSTLLNIDLSADGKSVWHSNISIDSEFDLSISPPVAELNATGDVDFRIKVECNGKILFSEDCTSEILRETKGVASCTECKIFGGVEIPEYIDTHTAENDMVPMGSLTLFNKGEECDILISVTVDGFNLTYTRTRIPEDDYEVKLEAPFRLLAKDYTHVSEVSANVTDSDGNVVLVQTLSVRVRSKYDLDLRRIAVRAAQFTNPHNPAIEKLVQSPDSDLARSMAGRYHICGYQNKGKTVVSQMKAVYDMLHGMKFRYVSDTFTFNSSEEAYQHVRASDRILKDRSGNCLELSILYASLLEAMDLEPIIAFPPGHAIVGVVLSTDIYPTTSDYTETEEIPYVTMKTADGTADVMFVEATACPWDSDFVDAVCLAYETITDNLQIVCNDRNHVFLKKARLMGIDPIPDL